MKRTVVMTTSEVRQGGVDPSDLELIQAVVDRLAERLCLDVLLDDSEFRPVAWSPQSDNVDRVRTQSILHHGVEGDVLAAARALDLGSGARPVRTPDMAQWGMVPRVCMSIRTRGKALGYLWVLDPMATIDHAGSQLVTDAGQEVAGLLDQAERRRAEEYRQRVHNLRLILKPENGTIDQTANASRDLLRQSGLGPDTLVVAVALGGGVPGPDVLSHSRAEALVRSRLGGSARSLTWFVSDQTPTVVLLAAFSPPSDATIDMEARIRRQVAEVAQAVAGTGAVAYLSGPPVPMKLAGIARRRALLVARVGDCAGSTTTGASWAELGSWRTLLRVILADQAEVFDEPIDADLPDAFLRLLASGNAELTATLDCYLEAGCDTRLASERLHIHRTTLYYRLRRIEEITGADLRSAPDRFDLMLASRLARLGALGSSTNVE